MLGDTYSRKTRKAANIILKIIDMSFKSLKSFKAKKMRINKASKALRLLAGGKDRLEEQIRRL